jgi:hypothetical protein
MTKELRNDFGGFDRSRFLKGLGRKLIAVWGSYFLASWTSRIRLRSKR